MSTSLRLLADDLTGALDSAAEFIGLCGQFEVGWEGALPGTAPPSLAVDSGTRERTRAEAVEIVSGLAPLLQEATIAYKKVDSLMRGFWAAELATCFRLGNWRHCIVAPAFPYQGRFTRDGRQYAGALDGSWNIICDLAAELRAEGLIVGQASKDAGLIEGVNVFDAETDQDLDGIVSAAWPAAGPVLWCGSGGLARALAGGYNVVGSSWLKRPVLGLFGSDHPVTAAQLAACAVHWTRLSDDRAQLRAIERHMTETGVTLISLDVPHQMSRSDGACWIAVVLRRVAGELPPPGTLIVSGGETLKSLCTLLDTKSLLVTGQVAPGLPRSVMRGGLWDSVDVVSKSGAFGLPTLWRDLLTANGLMSERVKA